MDDLTTALIRIGQATRSIGLTEARGTGLTPVQAQALLFVKRTKSFATTVGNLARHLGATHASTVGVIDGLVQRELLVRQSDPGDRRVTLLRLTTAGQVACDHLTAGGGLLQGLLADLSAEQRAILERRLGQLIWVLRGAGHLPVAEPCRGCTYFREDDAAGVAEPHYCGLLKSFLSEDEALKDCPDHRPVRSVG